MFASLLLHLTLVSIDATATAIPRIPRDLEQHDYAYSATVEGAVGATNHAQGLNSRIHATGIEVTPIAGGAEDGWELALQTTGFGFAGDVRALDVPERRAQGNRVELDFGALVEWYVNDTRGIEQGWTIASPPPGALAAPLRIDVAIAGLERRVRGDGLALSFVDATGELRLNYQGLRAWDAQGNDLRAMLLATDQGFAVEIAGSDLAYPVTVDPVLSGPTWRIEGNQHEAEFGRGAAGAGDVNGDGFDDVIVGAPLFNAGQANEGRAFLYYGSPTGPPSTADWTAESDQATAEFGRSVCGAGDVNGDGFDDVVVGAPFLGSAGTGAAFLYLGSPAGPSLAPDWMSAGPQGSVGFGWSVSSAGDVNADGYDDVLVGDPLFGSAAQPIEGAAYLYFGSATGLLSSPAWSSEGNQVGAYFGYSLAAAGDLNGDGMGDVIIGAPFYTEGPLHEGAAFVFLGSMAGLETTWAWKVEGEQEGALFGTSVAGAGDVDRDGFDDILVGAISFDHGQLNEGRAFLFRGGPSGPSPTPDWNVEGNQDNASLGSQVAGGGDLNGDGYDDILIAAPLLVPGEVVLAYLGAPTLPTKTPAWIEAGGDPDDSGFGFVLAGAGDVNGDGFADVIVSAPRFDNPLHDEGAVFLYTGRSGGLGTKYCSPAVPNSSGLPGVIDASGSRVVSDNALVLDATQLPVNQFGYFLVSKTQGFVSNPGGSQGNLCLGGTIGRYAKDVASTGAAGTLSLAIDLTQLPPPINQAVLAGQTWNFQLWFRDVNPTTTSNFTDGVSILFE